MTFKPNDENLIKKYPHFERILDECFELDIKIEKLSTFLNSKNVSTVLVMNLCPFLFQILNIGIE